MANKAAYAEMGLVDFIRNYLQSRRFDCSNNEGMIFTLKSRKAAIDMTNREIRDLKVRFERPDGAKRDYRMNKLGKNAHQQTFFLESKKAKVSIAAYFKEEYNYMIKFPQLPVVHVGAKNKSNYLPMELLELKRQACPQSKVLGDVATSEMIKVTAVRPDIRQKFIRENLRERQQNHLKNGHAEAFGISVADKFESIDGRILNAPSLAYGSKRNDGNKENVPSGKINGKWRTDGMQFLVPKPLKEWAILDLCDTRDNELKVFADAIVKEARNMGMDSDLPSIEKTKRGESDEKVFRQLCEKKPSIVVVIQFDKSADGPRARLKRIGDSITMVPTSFVLKKNVSFRQGGPSPATIHNIVLKLNSKLGGKNLELNAPSKGILKDNDGPVFGKPIMFVGKLKKVRPFRRSVIVFVSKIGADVTHPAPDQMGLKPSIAAVVASCDPAVSLYNVEVNVQCSKQDNKNVVEQIMNLEEMMKNLLMKFWIATGKRYKPQRIVFYRGMLI